MIVLVFSQASCGLLQGKSETEISTTEATEELTESEETSETTTESTTESTEESTVPAPSGGYAEEHPFYVEFLDVGQGDAALVYCEGEYMLIDGGNSKQSQKIYTILMEREIGYLKYIVASHPDTDHVGGLNGALSWLQKDKSRGFGEAMCTTDVVEDEKKSAFRSFKQKVEEAGKKILIPDVGDQFSLGSAEITVIAPHRGEVKSDNTSLVLRVEYKDFSILFTGDAETADDEKTILADECLIQADILKVAHHGSKYSTSDAFLDAVRPIGAIISVGKQNDYGHPTEEVLGRLEAHEVEILRTDIFGDILLYYDGEDFYYETEKYVDEEPAQRGDVPMEPAVPEPTATEAVIAPVVPTYPAPQVRYIGNRNPSSMKFHERSCPSVDKMNQSNKVELYSREEAIERGFTPCKRCNP